MKHLKTGFLGVLGVLAVQNAVLGVLGVLAVQKCFAQMLGGSTRLRYK
jgi:hypothetical protein